jgi:hypothetical protein
MSLRPGEEVMDVLLANVRNDSVLDDKPGSAALAVPVRPDDLAAAYDLTISHPEIRQETFVSFDRWLAEAAAAHGLSCALIHQGVVEEAVRRLSSGQLAIGFHLDYFALWHDPADPYARLSQAVQDAGGRPINVPARSRAFTDKAAAHAELLRRGLGVPDTVIVRPWMEDRPLTADERARLRLDEPGAWVYVKPANSFGGKGVVRVEMAKPETFATVLALARAHDRQDTYLIQREVRCPRLVCDDGVERPAYWRVLSCLGELIPFWWSGPLSGYRRVTAAELRRHRLQPLLHFTEELGELSGLDWFSTELCLSDGPEASRHRVRGEDGQVRPVVAIDYLNDQCDVDVQSRWPGAPPDAVVRHIAWRFAEAAWRSTSKPTPAEGGLRLVA